jgi:phosphoenolpyruvate carboxylase
VSTVLWYLETRLIDAGAAARETLVRAFEEEFAVSSDALRRAVPVRIGNWVGGDRDGNPFVTPDVTIATARRGSYSILGRYSAALKDLVERLSVSAALAPPAEELRETLEIDRRLLPDVWETNRRRNADEPVRL